MNRAALRDTCRDAHAVLDRLLKILEAIDEERDDWVVFLYRARKQYDRSAAKVNKSGKQVVATAERLFMEAGRRGYQGTFQDWIALMRIPFEYEEPKSNGLIPERPRR